MRLTPFPRKLRRPKTSGFASGAVSRSFNSLRRKPSYEAFYSRRYRPSAADFMASQRHGWPFKPGSVPVEFGFDLLAPVAYVLHRLLHRFPGDAFLPSFDPEANRAFRSSDRGGAKNVANGIATLLEAI
ncbi:hypothetical protein IE4771_PB00067 (plasmid) [Rhizobium etli bv. mimosae str. IE4771]|uniref:Uncharacterized protein n=1 Tax=Rhizobium etli bv. mimosae str. IE4771 TaxID=1432050 RepID=A0A060I7E5_RHIET|nr:hypothetical protein IE4771_PB00067 [Rhizobium sp. IE4771]